MSTPVPAHKFVRQVWGRNVRKARLRLELTQAELARRLGVSQSVVSEFETGDYTATRTDLLLRLSVALGEEPGELFEWPYAIRAVAANEAAA